MSTFFSTVITIVIQTPIWVWPLYALLLFLGFQRHDSTVALWRVLPLPVVATLLAILSFINRQCAEERQPSRVTGPQIT